jgi:DNA replication and repair protein RecF
LKLAEAEVIYDEKEDYPILLLDDFMSELDKKRVKGFIKRIKDNQVLITCTDKFDIDNMVYNVYKVEKANVERMK